MAVVWLVVGVVLMAVELHHFAFYALFGALAALAATLVAVVAPSAIPLQVLVFVAVTVVGVALDAIGDEHAPGHVRLAGERWLAVSGSDAVLPAGTVVTVTAVRGTTLWVWPVRGAVPQIDAGAEQPSDPAEAPDGAEGATS